MVAWPFECTVRVLVPGDGWPSTQRSAPSLVIGEAWSTQSRSAELAEVQGHGHTICVKSLSSPAQTMERMLGRSHCHSPDQLQETNVIEVGNAPRKAWSLALPSTDTVPSFFGWFLALAFVSEARQTHGCPCASWTSHQVVLAECL